MTGDSFYVHGGYWSLGVLLSLCPRGFSVGRGKNCDAECVVIKEWQYILRDKLIELSSMGKICDVSCSFYGDVLLIWNDEEKSGNDSCSW